ncbi:MAG: hypothetical protein ABT08_04940 [Microbacterium sp. SCN 71-21]|uniref:hypothetical protein n=1 Tax=Microbacterium sp. SCN 71-21 TaxID=1660116 RepID=UPI00086A8E0C|nr:hypothetical protein [Microbacterium sp. SCN 71-21]ODU78072.1 MAG: hypothetical protein ABT08_04940 [Microbacterium sp. SCN 71-21]
MRGSTTTAVSAASLVLGAVVLAVVVAPGTYGSFSSATSVSPATVTTGTPSLAITTGTPVTPAGVYPGGPADLIAVRTVTNGGAVGLRLGAAVALAGASSSNLGGNVVVSFATQTSATCAATPPASGLWTWSLAGGLTSPTTAPTLASGASATLCVWQSLPVTAANGTFAASASPTLTLTGSQTSP